MEAKLTSLMEPADVDISETLRWAVQSFNVDRVTAEVTTAFAAASIESILLKGPAIAMWLYSGDRPRLYTDTDLLIQKRDWGRAMDVMKELGFRDDLGPLAHPRMESGAGYPWGRVSDGAEVDLHYTLFGIGAGPEILWSAFSEEAIREPLGGIEVCMPSHAARLLHISLHAVQHGGETQPKPMMDLECAVSQIPPSTWMKARQLAERLDGVAALAAGLSLTPDGERLAAVIDADYEPSVSSVLRLDGVPMAEGFQEIAETCTLRGKFALLAREVFPNPEFMRWWNPLARRGLAGLILAYGWRPIWLAYHAIPGYRTWRRATRRPSESRDDPEPAP